MADVIDELQIEINAKATKANDAIDRLVGKIDKLTASMSKIDGKGLASLAGSTKQLGNAMQALNGINAVNFANVTRNLKALNKLDTTGLSNLSKSIKNISSSFSGMKSTTKSIQNISELANGIKQLGYKSADKAITNIPLLATAMRQLMTELSKAPKVSRNIIDMTNALAKLARTGASSGAAARSLSQSFNTVSASSSSMKMSLRGATSGLSNLRQSILSAIGVAGGFYAIFRGIKESINISSDLTEVQNVVDVTFGNFKQKIEDLANVSIPELGMSELTVKEIGSRFQAMGVAMGISQKGMADMSTELTRLAGDMASFYNVEQKAVGEDLESIFTGQTKPLRQYGLDLTEATLQEWALKNGIDANINSMSQMEKTMLRYQYVMANTGAAQGDFLRTQDTWANQVRILKENFRELASVIGSSFINALKPLVKALNSAMSHIIAFAKVISNSLGKIFGWKYEDATGGIANDFEDAAGYADNLASGTGKAADNAKKLKQQLQGFHELNVLTSPTDNAGGGGGGGGAGGGATNADANGGQWVQTDSILKSYESQLDTLYKLGEHIGQTLTNAMNSIDWDSVYEGARNFGSGLASFLNGLISPELFGATGKTIAASLNTALYALNSFGTTFDWNDFGVSIGTGINNFFSTFDFKALGSTLKTWASGLLASLTTAIGTVDWSQIGKSIGELINSIDIGDLLLDFSELALNILKALGDAMKSLITENPLAGGITTVLLGIKFTNKLDTLASGVLKALGTSIKDSKNSSVVGTALGNVFSKLASSGVGTLLGDFSLFGAATAGEIAGAIAIALPAALATAFAGFNLGNWLYENVDGIQNFSDNLVSLMLPDVKVESGDTTREDVISQEYRKWIGQSGISTLDLQPYLTELGDAYDYATSMGMQASEAIAYAHIAAIESFSDMVNSEEKVATEYELYGATYKKVKSTMVSTSKTSAKQISKSTLEEVMAYKEGKTSIESLSSSAKENLSNVSNYVKEYLDFKQGKISFTGLSSGAKQAFSTIDVYVKKNKISTQELARQYDISYSSMYSSVVTSMNNSNSALAVGGDKMTSTAQTKSLNIKTAYLTGLNGMPSDVANKFSEVNNTLNNSMDKSKASASVKSNELRSAMLSGFNGMPSNVAERMNAVRAKIASQNWRSLGTNLTAGLGNGINNSWKGNILNKVIYLANNLTAKLKSAFNIHSPSRLWRDEIGVQLTKGLGVGIEDATNYALESVSNLSKNINGAIKNDFFEGEELRLVKSYDMFDNNALKKAINISPTMQTSNTGNDFSAMNNQLAYTASAIAKVADRLNNDSSQPIIINLDGREVFNSTRKYANDYYNKTGRPAFNM